METKEIMQDTNEILKDYNYIPSDDNVSLEEIPGVVSHLLLLRALTHESIKYGIAYDKVEAFCDYVIEYMSEKEDGQIDNETMENIVSKFKAS